MQWSTVVAPDSELTYNGIDFQNAANNHVVVTYFDSRDSSFGHILYTCTCLKRVLVFCRTTTDKSKVFVKDSRVHHYCVAY
jgi:hypothetical protein